MNLDQWAARWALPPLAILELKEITAATSTPHDDRSESAVASACRLELAKRGVITMRNNVGVLDDRNGRPVRYGLCNETPAMNRALKSADDICIVPYTVTPSDIGRKLGVFLGVEHKKADWIFTGAGRETPQANFHRMVASAGGVSLFANSAQGLIDSLVNHRLLSP